MLGSDIAQFNQEALITDQIQVGQNCPPRAPTDLSFRFQEAQDGGLGQMDVPLG